MGLNTYYINGAEHSEGSLIGLAKEMSRNKFCSSHERDLFNFILEWFDLSDTLLVQTSGSTGKPKSIQLSKRAMEASARATLEFLQLQPKERALLCLSTNYIAGKMMVVRAFVGELDLHIEDPSLSPLEHSEKSYAFAAMVPAQAEASLPFLDRVDKLIVGGGTINPQLEKALSRSTTQCYSTYGMTETITHIAMREVGKEEYYKALPGVTLATTSDQCLIIGAPFLRSEIQTTDVVDLKDNSTFKWLGRSDFVINSGGVKIHPEIVEKKLNQKIENRFFVTSQPDQKWGEVVALIIEGHPIEINDSIYEGLSKVEKPKAVRFVPQFIETATGKVDRRKTAAQITS